MSMQIFATLLIGGFVTLALIGHVALLQALFFPLQPLLQNSQAAESRGH